jgi:geranylgeranyl diphosphate synthase type I
MLASAEVVGGDPRAVIPAAVGAECGHAASLVHDDIIDKDDMRRGRSSVHREFGIDEAIIAGDSLIFHLFAGLAECHDTGIPDSRITRALGAVARAGIAMCRGQSIEAEMGRAASCTAREYLAVIQLKTGAFFRGVCESGAILGGGRPDWVDAVGWYGERLGIAFQIDDDLLGYTSDTATMGKAATSDIRNRRLTLPIIYAYAAADASGRRAIDLAYAAELNHEEALASLREILGRTGGLAAAQQAAGEYSQEAVNALATLPGSLSRDMLAGFASISVNRKY